MMTVHVPFEKAITMNTLSVRIVSHIDAKPRFLQAAQYPFPLARHEKGRSRTRDNALCEGSLIYKGYSC